MLIINIFVNLIFNTKSFQPKSLAMVSLTWSSLKISPNELSLARVLRCGQAFRWKNINNTWSCSIGSQVIFLKQTETHISYSSYPENPKLLEIIKDYFNLDLVNLTDLYEYWSKVDPIFKKSAIGLEGVRILRQNPWENLISFICSSNNNIKRISQMCDNLCLHFGKFIVQHEGIDYYTFPTPQDLAQDDVELTLRNLSFGYRAKYIHKTAQLIHENNEDLARLRDLPYEETHLELLKYTGVGPKVADCVCLMSLDKHDSIPVDTHIYQIAKRDYKLKSKGEVVNKQTYEQVRNLFVGKWGEYAGWAQSIMFTSDLRDFNNGINKIEAKTSETKPTKVKREITPDNIKVKREIEEALEIEYSITGRPKRRKAIKIET